MMNVDKYITSPEIHRVIDIGAKTAGRRQAALFMCKILHFCLVYEEKIVRLRTRLLTIVMYMAVLYHIDGICILGATFHETSS